MAFDFRALKAEMKPRFHKEYKKFYPVESLRSVGFGRRECECCGRGFWSAEDYYGFVNTFKYDQEKVALDKYSIFEANRSRVIYNWLQYYNLETLTKEFTENGFKIGEALADTVGTPYSEGMAEIAVVALKRD